MENKKPTTAINTRSMAEFQPKTLRDSDNSVEFVLATEQPAEVMDWSRFEVVSETLIASGAVLPDNKQIPLLDCHDRSKIDNILGSVRDFRIEDNKLIGRLYFAKAEKAQKALAMVRDGFIDSGSVGYSQSESTWIPEGESYVFDNREFKGPLLLTTRWNLHEFSLVPVPADSNAKAREHSEIVTREPVNTAIAAVDNQIKKEDSAMEPTKESLNVEEIERAAATKAANAERERISAINSLCDRFNCRDLADTMINGGYSVDAANKAVLTELETRQKAASVAKPSVEMVADETDKFRAAATDGLLLRSGMNLDKAAAGAEDFRKCGFKGLAHEIYTRHNGHKGIVSDEEALKFALRAGTQAYADFSNILGGGIRKSVMQGYQQADNTWRLWCSKGALPNLEEFKKVGLADMPDLIKNPEGAEIKHVNLTDRGEAVQLETYAAKVALTRRALLADDLGLFNDIARKFGYRAAMKIEALAYGVLSGNANMSDGKAIFHADHHNLAGSSAALSKATLAAAYAAIRNQTDKNGTKLAINPKFLLVNPSDAVEAEVLTTSMIDVSASLSAGNTNFFKNHGIVAINSPFIGSAFYLVADPNGAPTVEIDFLDGKETPTIEEIENTGDILGKKWLCYIDIGAKALDFRGMFKNPTA